MQTTPAAYIARLTSMLGTVETATIRTIGAANRRDLAEVEVARSDAEIAADRLYALAAEICSVWPCSEVSRAANAIRASAGSHLSEAQYHSALARARVIRELSRAVDRMTQDRR